jgi:large subunit ribosomal protein L4
MIRLALRSALSDRAAGGKVLVVNWGIDAPKTSDAVAALAAFGVEGRALVVLRAEDHGVWKSLRNLQNVHICEARELNAYDVLVSDWVIFTEDTLPAGGDAAKSARRSSATGETRIGEAGSEELATESESSKDESDA